VLAAKPGDLVKGFQVPDMASPLLGDLRKRSRFACTSSGLISGCRSAQLILQRSLSLRPHHSNMNIHVAECRSNAVPARVRTCAGPAEVAEHRFADERLLPRAMNVGNGSIADGRWYARRDQLTFVLPKWVRLRATSQGLGDEREVSGRPGAAHRAPPVRETGFPSAGSSANGGGRLGNSAVVLCLCYACAW